MVKWQLVLVWSSMWSKSETRTFKAFGRTQTPRNMPVDPKWRSTSQNSIGERKEELLSVYVHGSGRFSRQKQLRKCPVGGRMWGWVSATRADTSYMSEEKAASSRKPDAILARVTFLVQANNIRYMIAFPLAFLETWALNFPKKAEMNMVWKKKEGKQTVKAALTLHDQYFPEWQANTCWIFWFSSGLFFFLWSVLPGILQRSSGYDCVFTAKFLWLRS